MPIELGLRSEERVLISLKGCNEAGSKKVENYKLEKLEPTVSARVWHYCCADTDKKKRQTGGSKSSCPLADHSPSPLAKPRGKPASKEEMGFRGSASNSQSRG